MFADSLNFAWDNRSHRGWTTAASFAAQILGVGVLFLLPLVYTQGLPQLQLLGPLIAPAPPPGPPRDLGHVHSTNRPQSKWHRDRPEGNADRRSEDRGRLCPAASRRDRHSIRHGRSLESKFGPEFHCQR